MKRKDREGLCFSAGLAFFWRPPRYSFPDESAQGVGCGLPHRNGQFYNAKRAMKRKDREGLCFFAGLAFFWRPPRYSFPDESAQGVGCGLPHRNGQFYNAKRAMKRKGRQGLRFFAGFAFLGVLCVIPSRIGRLKV